MAQNAKRKEYPFKCLKFRTRQSEFRIWKGQLFYGWYLLSIIKADLGFLYSDGLSK